LKTSFSGIFIVFISCGIGLFFLAGSWGAYSEYKRVQDYSGRAIGHITKKYFQTTADGSGKYYLDYWFMSSGSSKVNASSVIAKQQWETLQVKDNLEIRYDQSNPDRNIPLYGNSPSLVFAFFMLVLGAVFILFGGSRFFNSFH
jgi:subtilase family serine protease